MAVVIQGEKSFLEEDPEQGSMEAASNTAARVQEDILEEVTSDLKDRWE